jgi:hypothetical protein
MEKYSTTTNASDPEFPQTGAAANVNASLNPTDTDASSPADPLSAADVEEPSAGPGTGALPGMPSSPASDSCVTHAVVRISGITEIGRDSKTSKIGSWKPAFEVQKGYEASFAEICERAESVRFPAESVPVPTASTPYGAIDELFDRLQKAIAAQACLSEPASRLLAHWTLSTWFPDALSLAPALAVVGPGYEGEQVLCALRNFCRYPLMLMRADINSLKNVNWHTTPTLLFHDPSVTKQMASLLGCTATRGHLVGDAGYYRDFFGAKAVYLGEEVSADRIPLCSVRINVHPIAAARAIDKASRLTEIEVQKLQNELLNYRLKNLVRVYNSKFDASQLSSDTRAVTNALGACIIDSPDLQSQLISLLTPVESQREADRSMGIEAVALEATLILCHAGKKELLAGEISIEANRIQKARGERLTYSAEKIGHAMKKVGLYTRRLGHAGRGLAMDVATMVRVHELAAVYGVGPDQNGKNLHCPLCAENK